MAVLYGRAGRLTVKTGGFRPGQVLDFCDPDQSKVNAIRAELEMMYPPKKDRNKPKASASNSDDEGPGPPGAVTRPARFPPWMFSVRRVCMGAQGA
jgi:hypothetical protein